MKATAESTCIELYHLGRVICGPDPATAGRQPRESTPGTLQINTPYRAGLRDLEGFSHIYLLALFDRHLDKRQWSLQVRPPWEQASARGLFATRSPHRPNPLALSLCPLLSIDVEAGCIELAHLDLFTGTPILDIKPYVPGVDAHPDAHPGWTANLRWKPN